MVSKPKVLVIGDSITHNANFRLLEKATSTTIHTAKAYSADFDVSTRFPNKNVKYVARNAARKKSFKVVMMQSPSVDITNINTFDNSSEVIEGYKKIIDNSTTKMFETDQTIIE